MLLLTVSLGAWSQQVVRVTRGDGVTILPNGPTIRIGSEPSAGSGLVRVERDRVCCPGPNVNPQTRCVTERQLPLGASRTDVIERYGPPASLSTEGELRYPGIVFAMAGGRVSQICAVR